MKITKQLFPDYSIVRHTHYGRILDYVQVGFISLTANDIAALLNGKILDVEVGDTPTLIRFQQYEPDEPYDNNWGMYLRDLDDLYETDK